MRKGHIGTFTFDGILGQQVNAEVIDTSTATATSVHQVSVVLPVLRCKVWGLLHGYGWLRVV